MFNSSVAANMTKLLDYSVIQILNASDLPIRLLNVVMYVQATMMLCPNTCHVQCSHSNHTATWICVVDSFLFWMIYIPASISIHVASYIANVTIFLIRI